MIKIEKTEVTGWEAAIRGMRNPMNSWDKSDSDFCIYYDHPDDLQPTQHNEIGPKDFDLMKRLAKNGSVHAKYRRMISVYADITAPLYWWKEFETYKVGTVVNSCSTMHKIADKELSKEDFSHEHLLTEKETRFDELCPIVALECIISNLNYFRKKFLETKDKCYWWQMIQLLPSSYNQKRTVMMNYEVLSNIYHSRKDHKLDEWRELCRWIKTLPYSEIITDL